MGVVNQDLNRLLVAAQGNPIVGVEIIQADVFYQFHRNAQWFSGFEKWAFVECTQGLAKRCLADLIFLHEHGVGRALSVARFGHCCLQLGLAQKVGGDESVELGRLPSGQFVLVVQSNAQGLRDVVYLGLVLPGEAARAFLVNQLEDTGQDVVIGAQRHREHLRGPHPGFLVPRAVKSQGRAEARELGGIIGIGNIDRFAVAGDEPDNALFVEGHADFLDLVKVQKLRVNLSLVIIYGVERQVLGIEEAKDFIL